jgi:hypothetical protein
MMQLTEVLDMTSVLPSSLSAGSLVNWLVGGMVAVIGFTLMQSTLSPALKEIVEKKE